jgi:hypothetical protein
MESRGKTGTDILVNRPDIIIENKRDNICLLIDVAIPLDRNAVQKEAEKKLKYKNLSVEILRMWNVECVTPVIIESTGPVTKGLKSICKQYQESIQ